MTLQTLLDDIEAKARAATPGVRTVRDHNEDMEPQYGSMWVVENEDNNIEDDESLPFECQLYYGCKEDADLIARMDPPTTLALVSALRVAMEALESIASLGNGFEVVMMDRWTKKDILQTLETDTNTAREALTHIDELFEKEKTK